jgi:hypothetical protein
VNDRQGGYQSLGREPIYYYDYCYSAHIWLFVTAEESHQMECCGIQTESCSCHSCTDIVHVVSGSRSIKARFPMPPLESAEL